MSTFINFRDLRAQLSFRTVLRHYGVTIDAANQTKYQGPCPLPTHLGESRKASFSVDYGRGIWQCFGCKASGNLLDFAVRMEGFDPANGPDVRKTALGLQKKFIAPGGGQAQSVPEKAAIPPAGATNEIVNAPLEFNLKGLDQAHPSVMALGIAAGTIAHFGIGYCSRGSLKGRIAIPLHDPAGHLVGYAGRLPNAAATSTTEPLYRFPSSRERDGVKYEFEPGALLYGAHFIVERPVTKLIIAEDLSLVWHLFELGVQAVGILTPNISPAHENLLQRLATTDGLVFVGRSVANRAT